jgi:hypothetical protein
VVSQIRRQSLVALHPRLPSLLNLTCTLLQKHLHRFLPNPFSIIEVFPRQPGLECLKTMCNSHLEVHGSISQLFQTGLSSYN